MTDLGLFEAPPQIDARATGITLWTRGDDAPLLWLPAQLGGFLRYRPQDWKRLIGFSTFLAYAFLLDRKAGDEGTLSVDDWVGQLTLLDDEFKDTILRPFLYQFVTLPRARIGEASAKYAITYFVRNVFGEPGVDEPQPPIEGAKGQTFEVYQSRIGLDGVLDRALAAAGVIPRLNEPSLPWARIPPAGSRSRPLAKRFPPTRWSLRPILNQPRRSSTRARSRPAT